MKNRHAYTIALCIVFCAVSVVISITSVGSASAATSRSWVWRRWDVQITNIDTQANSFHVSETHTINVTQGSFAGGDRSVSLDRVASISNVSVSDGSTPLTYVSADSADNCPLDTGIYCLFTNDYNERDIYYNFLARTYKGQTRVIHIDYDVQGALRSYPDGDQLWWQPLATRRDYPVLASVISIQMPTDRPAQKLSSYSANWGQTTSGNIVNFTAPGTVYENDLAEIRIQYPHDPAMAVPAWQANDDRMEAFKVTAQPIISLLMVVLAGLLAIGGPLYMLIRYLTHGRDPEAVAVPEYLAEPPSDVPPAVVETLLEEEANMHAILGTLVDLARRGFLVIEQNQHQGFFDHSPDFIFHRTDKSTSRFTALGSQFLNLHPAAIQAALVDYRNQMTGQEVEADTGLHHFERLLLDGVFKGSVTTTHLSELRNHFYSVIPTIKESLYQEVVHAGYFAKSPESVRSTWGCLGFLALAFGGGGSFFLFVNGSTVLQNISPLLPLPLFGLAIFGLLMLVTAHYMPSKTPVGSQEAAKWRAFRTYLRNIRKYTDLQQAGDQFEKYIGYAVAFGIDQQWIREFSPVLTSMPGWYYPTYLGGPWGGGYRPLGGYGNAMSPMSGSGLNQVSNMSGASRLNSMSQNLSQGLNAMSSSLTNLLDSASSVMTSSPSSSGGGFSGGGGGGGGGGGRGGGGGHQPE